MTAEDNEKEALRAENNSLKLKLEVAELIIELRRKREEKSNVVRQGNKAEQKQKRRSGLHENERKKNLAEKPRAGVLALPVAALADIAEVLASRVGVRPSRRCP